MFVEEPKGRGYFDNAQMTMCYNIKLEIILFRKIHVEQSRVPRRLQFHQNRAPSGCLDVARRLPPSSQLSFLS